MRFGRVFLFFCVFMCFSFWRVCVQAKHGDGRLLKRINELEFVNGYIFANVWFDDNLYKIDPVTGEVVDTYNLTELYPKVCTSYCSCYTLSTV